MKAFITPAYTFTPGASGVGTINLSGIPGFEIKRLLAVINQTRGLVLYSTANASLTYTSIAGTTLTLMLDTSTMNASDVIQVVYEEIGQKASAASHSMVLSTEQEAILSAISGKDFSTGAKQDIAKGALDNILSAIGTTNGKDFATATKQDAHAALTGPVNETAPTTDIASSGLNGRLQRIAQRLSLLITDLGLMSAKLPAAIGSLPSNQSLSVVLPTDQAAISVNTVKPGTGGLTTAKVTVGTTAVRATTTGSSPSVNRKKLFIKPHKDNTGNIYLGSSLVTIATGLEVIGPDRVEFEGYYDFYLVSDTVSQSVEIMELL